MAQQNTDITLSRALKALLTPLNIGYLLLLHVALLAPIERSAPLEKSFDPGAHMLVFSILTIILLRARDLEAYIRQRLSLNYYVFVIVVALIIALQTEFTQLYFHRSFELQDIGFNITGILLTTLTYHWWKRRARIPALIILTPVVILGLIAPTRIMIHRAFWSSAFPEIMTFKHNWEDTFLIVRDAKTEQTALGRRFNFAPGEYPGFSVIAPYPDWTGYDSLSFICRSESDTTIDLHFAIFDENSHMDYNERFNRILKIEPNRDSYSIALDDIKRGPRSRELDLAHITNITVFLYNSPTPITLEFGRINLK